MKNRSTNGSSRLKGVWLLALALACPFWFGAEPAAAQGRMRPEDVIARHLEAIGAAETRATVRSRVIAGTGLASFRTPASGQIEGQAVLASEGNKSFLGITFDNAEYPFERLGFDGSRLTAGYVRPGTRTTLADFLLTHDVVFKQGLIGGALSTAWPLYNMPASGARAEYAGLRRVENREAHTLRFRPRGSSDLRITLYFDQETFHHIRTEYDRSIAGQIGGGVDASARQSETRYKLIEDFSDFRPESGLTLPHTYKLTLRIEGTARSFIADWTFTLTQFAFNQPIAPQSFSLQAAN